MGSKLENTGLAVNPEKILDEYAATTSKLAKGFEMLKKVSAPELGTAQNETVWKKNRIELLRYRGEIQPSVKTPVLVVYALVNRHHMMDIQPDRSLIRNLQASGLDIFLINWGYPMPEDKYCTMDEYVNGYINDAVDVIRRITGQKATTIMGICQGGTFSVIYSALHPAKVKNLVTMVTPVDFHTTKDTLSLWARHLNADALVDSYGNIPGELLNQGFDKLKPMLKISKYLSIMNALDKEEQLLNFLRMEHWIADSPNQAGECFRQFIKDLYQENKLVKGTFRLGNTTVDLGEIDMPLLNIYAAEDHLVPPEASMALNNLVSSKDKCLTRFQGGHIGVFVGSRSQKELAPAIALWLKERDNND